MERVVPGAPGAGSHDWVDTAAHFPAGPAGLHGVQRVHVRRDHPLVPPLKDLPQRELARVEHPHAAVAGLRGRLVAPALRDALAEGATAAEQVPELRVRELPLRDLEGAREHQRLGVPHRFEAPVDRVVPQLQQSGAYPSRHSEQGYGLVNALKAVRGY